MVCQVYINLNNNESGGKRETTGGHQSRKSRAPGRVGGIPATFERLMLIESFRDMTFRKKQKKNKKNCYSFFIINIKIKINKFIVKIKFYK